MSAARLILVLTISVIGSIVFLLARGRDARRVFFLDLGREVEERDRRRVRRVIWVDVIASGAGIAATLLSKNPAGLALIGVLVPLIPLIWLLVEAALLIRSAPEPRVPDRFVVPLGARPSVWSYVSWPLQIVNLAAFALSAAGFWMIRTELPERVPLHFDAAGVPNRWGSPDELWMFAGLMLFNTALLWVIVWSVARERWALPAEAPELYATAQRRRRQLIVRFVECLMTSIDVSFGVMWFWTAFASLPGKQHWLAFGIVVSVVLLLASIVGSLWAFMRPLLDVQERLRKLAGTGALGTRADGWRAGGIIYYAPDDPAVFVPKQRGIGQTLNFARPTAWIFMAAILVLPLGIALLTQAVGKH